MRKLSVALVLVLLVSAFMWVRHKPTKGKEVSHVAKNETEPYLGELGPYFTGKEYHYVGTFYKQNFSYILENEGGALSNALSENHKVANIWTAHEAIVVIIQQNSTKKFAIIDPSSPETTGLTFDKIKFQDALQGSDLAQAWARASSPESFSKDRKKGKTHNWVFVESGPTPTGTRQVYVGDEININSDFNCRAVPLLEVTQTNYMLFLDPKNRKFAPVKTDAFGAPTEEMKYRDITPGGVAEAVMKILYIDPAKP
jgi:hypothetical protein